MHTDTPAGDYAARRAMSAWQADPHSGRSRIHAPAILALIALAATGAGVIAGALALVGWVGGML